MARSSDRQEQHVPMPAHLRRVRVINRHLASTIDAHVFVVPHACRASPSHSEAKVCKAGEAVALIPDSAVITVRPVRHMLGARCLASDAVHELATSASLHQFEVDPQPRVLEKEHWVLVSADHCTQGQSIAVSIVSVASF